MWNKIMQIAFSLLIIVALSSCTKNESRSTHEVTSFKECLIVEKEMVIRKDIYCHGGVWVKEGATLVVTPNVCIYFQSSKANIINDSKIILIGIRGAECGLIKCSGIFGTGEIYARNAYFRFEDWGHKDPDFNDNPFSSLQTHIVLQNKVDIRDCEISIRHAAMGMSNGIHRGLISCKDIMLKDSVVSYSYNNNESEEDKRLRWQAEYANFSVSEPTRTLFVGTGILDGCRIENASTLQIAMGGIELSDCIFYKCRFIQGNDHIMPFWRFRIPRFCRSEFLDNEIKVQYGDFEYCFFVDSDIEICNYDSQLVSYSKSYFINSKIAIVEQNYRCYVVLTTLRDCVVACCEYKPEVFAKYCVECLFYNEDNKKRVERENGENNIYMEAVNDKILYIMYFDLPVNQDRDKCVAVWIDKSVRKKITPLQEYAEKNKVTAKRLMRIVTGKFTSNDVALATKIIYRKGSIDSVGIE